MLRRLHLEGNCAQPETLNAIAALELDACDLQEVALQQPHHMIVFDLCHLVWQSVAPTGAQLDGRWTVVAGAQAGVHSEFWTGSWIIVSGEGNCLDCIMKDIRSDRAMCSALPWYNKLGVHFLRV